MSRAVVAPKTQSETRIDSFDFSPDLAAGVTLTGATVSYSIYSGAEPSSALTLTAATSSPKVNITTASGYVGTIYSIRILGVGSDGTTPSRTYFLSILPDAI